MAISETGRVFYGQEIRQPQLPTRIKGEDILKPDTYIPRFKAIGSSTPEDDPRSQTFIDVERAIREGDPNAWSEAIGHTQEDKPLREAVEHLIFLDSAYYDGPQES